MLPGFQQINLIESDFFFRKKPGKDFSAKDIFQIFMLNGRGDFNHRKLHFTNQKTGGTYQRF
jgi:hypothetical protein